MSLREQYKAARPSVLVGRAALERDLAAMGEGEILHLAHLAQRFRDKTEATPLLGRLADLAADRLAAELEARYEQERASPSPEALRARAEQNARAAAFDAKFGAVRDESVLMRLIDSCRSRRARSVDGGLDQMAMLATEAMVGEVLARRVEERCAAGTPAGGGA